MKKVKSGFSMVELLFVMAVMAALAAIAIPSLSDSKESVILTSMKSDARNAITKIQNEYINTESFVDIADVNENYVDEDNDGLADTELLSGGTLVVSKDNIIYFRHLTNDCFSLYVTNDNIDKKVVFKSCESSKIKVIKLANTQ